MTTSTPRKTAARPKSRRKPQPRYVHGGGHRNKSTVNVGKNVVNEYSPPPEFTTTHNALYQYNQQLTPRPRHQFDLPQKNTSTFMALSHHVTPSPAGSSPRGPGVGRIKRDNSLKRRRSTTNS